ncbi:hypothetical protein HK102_003572, partial [Quaeritorhiza haematococci]
MAQPAQSSAPGRGEANAFWSWGRDEPVYPRLEVRTLFESLQLEGLQNCRPWRLNLLAASKRDPTLFFVAVFNQVCAYRLPYPGAPPDVEAKPFVKLNVHEPSTAAELPPGSLDQAINALKIGQIGTDEVLVAVDNGGEVRVWFTSSLTTRPPICLNNDNEST